MIYAITLYPNVYYYRATRLVSAVLGVVTMSVCPSVCHTRTYCFVTNPKKIPATFLYHILITANMQSKTGFPSSHQLKSYLDHKSISPAWNSRRAVLSALCWPCYFKFVSWYSE